MFGENRYFYKIVYLTICLITIFGFAYGYIYTTGKIQNEQLTPIGSYEVNTQEQNNYGDDTEDVINSGQISSNATLIRQITYSECGHTIVDNEQIQDDTAKLTEQQFRIAYDDWKIEKFSPDEIIISKIVEGKCPNHFIVKAKNGRVAVFYQQPINGVDLKELTNISVSSLSKSDQMKLKEGIEVDSNEKLAELLEDFGS